MSPEIEMTVRGVLLALKWAKESELPPEGAQDPKILDGWRNGLISAIVANTNQKYYQDKYHVESGTYFQGFDNERLIGIGAVIVFLLEAGFYDSQTIRSHHDDALRNDLIVQNNFHTGRSVAELQNTSNQRLVQIGLQWFPTSTTPKHPRGDGSLDEPSFGDPNNTEIDPTVFGYFQMIFERARTSYLASDPEQAQQAHLLLGWINNVLPAPPEGKTYVRIEAFINSVVAAKSNIEQKRDYYGHAWNHVPTCSLEFYKVQLASFLAAFEKIEQKYEGYMSASRKDQERHSDYESALEKTESLCLALERERDHTRDLINQAVADIDAKELEVEAAKPELLKKIHDLAKEINEIFQLPGPEQLAGILLNLSFMPQKNLERAAMIGSQSLSGSSSLSKIRMDDGTEIEKSLVVNRLDILGRDIDSLSAGYTVSQKFIQKDAGVYRVIQKAEQFEQLCDNFYNQSSRAREAKASMEDYIRKIGYRNAKIDEYNAMWARFGDVQGQLSKLNADKDSKAIELARSENPGLPHRVAAFDNLYSRARDTGLKYLYLMSRAYSFWALKPYDELTSVCKLLDPDSIDHVTLTSAMKQIEADCASEIEGVHAVLREGSFPDKNADSKKATGIVVTLTQESHRDFIESLKDKGSAWFELPTTHESFAGRANVRLTKVRAWIHGLKTGNDIHDVTITHCGPETIVTTDRKPLFFLHDPVTVPFRYDASKGVGNPKAIFEGGGGPHDGVILEENYAPIGPFTDWRLEITEDTNPDRLDRSGISKVAMEFHIIAQNFARQSEFIGTWSVKDGAKKSFEITLSGDGAAMATRGEDGTDGAWVGVWKIGNTAVITWKTGWTTKIAKDGKGYKKTVYKKGQSLDGAPTNSSDAKKR